MHCTRLVAFDLDGTLTRGNCLQAVAAGFGFAERMSVWEHAVTEEELTDLRADLWHYLKHRGSNEAAVHLAGIPLAPGAREGIAALHAAGVATVIVSLAWAPHVAYFARLLGIDVVIATEPDGDGGFRHVFPATKATLLAEHAGALGVPPDQIAAVGDSAGDVPMLRASGISIYVGTTLPIGFRPTWHLPAAPVDQIARVILAREPA